jgi:hypothetical protein
MEAPSRPGAGSGKTWRWLLLSTTCACAAPQAALLDAARATHAEAEEVQILRAQDATRVQREQRARSGPIADEDLTGKVLAKLSPRLDAPAR